MASDIGFNDTTVINSDNKATLLAMFDKLTRIAEGRRILPHNQLNNVTYAHRLAFSTYGLQIGDACFMIPPEFICVTSESTSQQVVTLRQENTMRQKAGSRKRTLLIDLVFNGFDQINGYRVEGPESVHGKDYYVDGLRQMLAQFKCTPFLPVQSEFLNGVHGIFAVVLQGITISTVPGFPTLMKAQLTLQEVEMFPYLEMPNAAFKSLIDWDLFRYYYQRFLTETHEYKKLQSLPANKDYNRFKLSILNESVFSSISENAEKYGNKDNELLKQIVDNDNYDVWVDSDTQDVKINGFQCGYYNILTNMQLSDTSCPTVQFMGGMDTIFNISIETTDVTVVNAIEQCRMYNDTMTRNNAKYRSLGFVKLESELVSFTGSLFVVIDNVITATVPEFPGLYQVQIQCVAFDIGQSARENLQGFTPFDDDIAKQMYDKTYSGSCSRLEDGGYISDHTHEEQTIEQSMQGLMVKVRQDCYAEWKMRTTMELYPDLYLPTYAEVDAFIALCNKFRVSKGLAPLPYTKYPTRPECMVQGVPLTNNIQLSGDVILAKDIPRHSEYNGFVDPDFYVFYPNSYASFDLDCYDTTLTTRTSITKDITITKQSSSAGGNGWNANLVDDFVELAYQQIGKAYSSDPSTMPNAFACTTLVYWCLQQVGVFPSDKTPSQCATLQVNQMLKNADGLDGGPQHYRRVSADEKRRGDLIILYKDNPPEGVAYKSIENCKHVMIFNGENAVVHAADTERGIIESAFRGSNPDTFDVLRIIAFETSTGSLNDAGSLEERQAVLWGALKSMGYTDAAAAGIVANWTAESNCKTRKLECDGDSEFKTKYGGYDVVTDRDKMDAWVERVWYLYETTRPDIKLNKDGYVIDGRRYCGIGLAQWTGNRAKAFIEFAGDSWDSLDTQLAFAMQELSTAYSRTDARLREITDDPRRATEIFCREYEGLNDEETVSVRRQLGYDIYMKFKGTNGTPYVAGQSAGTSGKDVLTRAEFESICKILYGQVEGMRDCEKEMLGLAQMVYDLLTLDSNPRTLASILCNRETFPEPAAEEVPENIKAIVESVFCENVKRWPESTVVAYLTAQSSVATFKIFGEIYDPMPDEGQLSFWEKTPRRASSDRIFTIVESDVTGSASQGSSSSTSTVTYPVQQAELDKFAEPVFVRSDAFLYGDKLFEPWWGSGSNAYKKDTAKNVLNDGGNIFGSSFVNEAQYSCRGRLVRAFPTYMFCILDDSTQWYMGNKLWTNYYMRKSVVDIQVHESNDMPTATAVLTVANVYGNLSTKQLGLKNYDVRNDLNWLQSVWYDWTQQVVDWGSPNLTESTIKLKQVIYSHARLREGSRAHIRIGYGSDPLSLAPVMNGTITEVSVGEQLTIVVTSDGAELANHVTMTAESSIFQNPIDTADSSSTNNGILGLFGLGEDQESSNLIANMLCKRDSIVNYFVSSWFEGSKYGIEHFGLYFNQEAMAVIEGLIDGTIQGAVGGWESGSEFGGEIGEAIGGDVGEAVGEVVGGVVGGTIGIIGGSLIGLTVGTFKSIFGANQVGLKDLWDGYAEQYDICKNIYKADYTREHYIYATDFLGIDGEKNICFNQNNMTPWDVMQISTQQVPEYIVKPTYHQFDSRLYFGLPLWMEKYRYDYLGGTIYEECKASTQVHMVESVTNIIDNQVKVTNKYTDTNKKVIFVEGGKATSTAVIHSDDTIDFAKQKTGIIDSAIAQDCLGPDALYSFLNLYNVGESSARRVGISNLLYGWQQQYQGEIICMGLPGVHAHDYILVNDTYTTMMGVALVREVTHSFSTDTGFTTSITPGLIGFDTEQRSGLIIAMQNYLQLFNAFASFLLARNMMRINYERHLQTLSLMAILEQKEKYILFNNAVVEASLRGVQGVASVGIAALTVYGVAQVGLEVYTFCKACIATKKLAELGRIATAAVTAFKTTWNTYKAVSTGLKVAKGAGQVVRLFKSISSGVTAAAGATFPPAAIVCFIIFTIIEILLNALFEWLENRNVCVLLPLWYEGSPFVSGTTGGKNILLCGNADTATNNGVSGENQWD